MVLFEICLHLYKRYPEETVEQQSVQSRSKRTDVWRLFSYRFTTCGPLSTKRLSSSEPNPGIQIGNPCGTSAELSGEEGEREYEIRTDAHNLAWKIFLVEQVSIPFVLVVLQRMPVNIPRFASQSEDDNYLQ